MKPNNKTPILSLIFITVIVYLATAFVKADIDFTNWTPFNRFMVIAVIGAGLYGAWLEELKNN